MRAFLALLLFLSAAAGLQAQQPPVAPRDASARASEHVRGLGSASCGGGHSATEAADGTFTIRDVAPEK